MLSIDKDGMKFLEATHERRNDAVARCCSDVRRFMCTQNCAKPEKGYVSLILDNGGPEEVEKRR